MITFKGGKPFVLEAVEPVRTTELATWIAHGTGGHYTVMRLKNRDTEIADTEVPVAQELAKKMLGRITIYILTGATINCIALSWSGKYTKEVTA
ncbi:MAG: hypothetical protein QM805_14600 [Pseudomonas sp.]